MKPRWAVLVYMGADDPDDKNLVVSAFKDIAEIRESGSSDAVRIGIQLDLQLFPPVRFLVNSDGTLTTAKRLRESSAGQPGTLASFLTWAQNTFDAERYLLILWGHGVGVGFQLEEPASLADVVFDSDDGLAVRELAGVLRRFKERHGRPLDLLGFDACYMSSIEIGYELRGLVKIVVGSQAAIPLAGWPYTPILRRLKANPRQSERALGRAIATEVVNSFATKDNVTQTALAPDATEEVREAFRKLVARFRALSSGGTELLAIRRALRTASYYEARQLIDLADLCQRVSKNTRDPLTRKAADAVVACLKHNSPQVIISHHRRGSQVKGLKGVSIYFRNAKSGRKGDEDLGVKLGPYRRLEFVRETGWQRFVDTLPGAPKATV